MKRAAKLAARLRAERRDQSTASCGGTAHLSPREPQRAGMVRGEGHVVAQADRRLQRRPGPGFDPPLVYVQRLRRELQVLVLRWRRLPLYSNVFSSGHLRFAPHHCVTSHRHRQELACPKRCSVRDSETPGTVCKAFQAPAFADCVQPLAAVTGLASSPRTPTRSLFRSSSSAFFSRNESTRPSRAASAASVFSSSRATCQ